MAKKRSRKSRKHRARTISPTPAVHETVSAAEVTSTAVTSRSPSGPTNFVQTYAYVYFDLRKMFLMAGIIFVLLILTNVVLRYFVVL